MKAIVLVVCILVATVAAEQVLTPFGYRPKNCVRQVPSGSHIVETKQGNEIHYPDGKVVTYPIQKECVESHARWLVERQQRRNSTRKAYADGWLDNASYFPSKEVDVFQGNYLVPSAPPSDSGQVLFYFIGTENTNSGTLSILQPVLTWGNGHSKWNMASWNCCPNGEPHTSDFIENIPDAASLGGVIDMSSDTTQWSVDSTYGSQKVTLTVPTADRNFNYCDVTLETYGVTQCSQMASSPMQFSNMALTLVGGTPDTPNWSSGQEPTECGGSLTINSPQQITITHTNSEKLLSDSQ